MVRNPEIDQYISNFPEETQRRLEQMRELIRNTVPEAKESMKYAIPTFELSGNLVHFAGYKTHIGFYPAPSGLTAFQEELGGYKRAKGSVQFPLDSPLPLELIRKIVEYRVQENLEKATVKKKSK